MTDLNLAYDMLEFYNKPKRFKWKIEDNIIKLAKAVIRLEEELQEIKKALIGPK